MAIISTKGLKKTMPCPYPGCQELGHMRYVRRGLGFYYECSKGHRFNSKGELIKSEQEAIDTESNEELKQISAKVSENILDTTPDKKLGQATEDNTVVVFEDKNSHVKADLFYNSVRKEPRRTALQNFSEYAKEQFKGTVSISVFSQIITPYIHEVFTKLGASVIDPDLILRIKIDRKLPNRVIEMFSKYSNSKPSENINGFVGSIFAQLRAEGYAGSASLYLEEILRFFNACNLLAFRFEINSIRKYVELCFNVVGEMPATAPTYDFGKTEKIAGHDFEKFEKRDYERLGAGKGWPAWPLYKPTKMPPYPKKPPELLDVGEDKEPVERYARDIIIIPPSATIKVGGKETFSAVVQDQFGRPMSARIVWKLDSRFRGDLSDNVGNNVVFKATSEGETILFAESGSLRESAVITIIPSSTKKPQLTVGRIDIVPQHSECFIGETIVFTAHVLDTDGKEMSGVDIDWNISQKIGTINRRIWQSTNETTFRGTEVGTAEITASAGEQIGRATAVVKEKPRVPIVTRVVISPHSAIMDVGNREEFIARVYDQDNHEIPDVSVSWHSSDTDVGATHHPLVNPYGRKCILEAKNLGITRLTATADGITDVASITVNPKPHAAIESISVEPNPGECSVGGEITFRAKVRDTNGDDIDDVNVSWNLADPAIGTLTPSRVYNNRVTFTAGNIAGTTTITASARGKSGSAAVTVNAEEGEEPEEETPVVLESFTTFFIKKIPNMLIIIIGMILFTMEQYSFGGGEFGIQYLIFAAGGSLIGIGATITSYFDIKRKQQPEAAGENGMSQATTNAENISDDSNSP